MLEWCKLWACKRHFSSLFSENSTFAYKIQSIINYTANHHRHYQWWFHHHHHHHHHQLYHKMNCTSGLCKWQIKWLLIKLSYVKLLQAILFQYMGVCVYALAIICECVCICVDVYLANIFFGSAWFLWPSHQPVSIKSIRIPVSVTWFQSFPNKQKRNSVNSIHSFLLITISLSIWQWIFIWCHSVHTHLLHSTTKGWW